MNQEPITKTRAVAFISMEADKSLRVVQQTLKDMEEAGEISMEKSPYSPAILISRDDIQKVIERLKKA